MRREALIFIPIFALAFGGAYWAYVQNMTPAPVCEIAPLVCNHVDDVDLADRVPVSTNRGGEIPDGFSGDIHPFLHRHSKTEVKAYWVPPETDRLDPEIPPVVSRLYREVSAAVPVSSYTERDFSALLPPDSVRNAGKMWAIEPAKFARFLKQFHPAVSTHSASVGRRPGPDGAFAVLRGVSASHLDIVFRVHAEFDLVPKSALGKLPITNAWYSPAYFLGRLVVNRDTGAVEYFQLGVPAEQATNVHTTMWIIGAENGGHFHNMHRVDRMELIGGSLEGLADVGWSEQIPTDKAYHELSKVFYKFKEIDFLPFDKTLATAREQKRPILVVVLLGGLDDQGC